jgi:amidase
MARYVEDLIYTLPILCGVDWRDPLTQPVQIRKPEKVKLEKLKIAYFVNNKIISPTTDTENTIREAIGFLARVAKKTVEVLPEPVERSFDLMYGFFGFGGSKIVAKRLEALGTMKVHPLVESFIERYPNEPYSADQISNLFVDWFKFRMEMLRFMEDYDVLISPVNASPAMEHGGSIKDEYFKGFSYVMTHSLTGWPGVVVRCGTSKEGLPIGVQIAAKPWREDIALAVALYLEKAMGGWQKP